LGIMGGAFAVHLAAAGARTLGYDPMAARREVLEAHGGEGRDSTREVAGEADLVITSLPSVKALDEALFGEEGVVAAGRRGLLVIETSTFPLEAKERAKARLAEAGIAMLDAPISGTGPQAAAKDITVLVSGQRADYERALGVLSNLARSVRYVGDFGAGSKVKYIANLLVAVHVLATAEAIVLGEKAGLDPAGLVEILAHSAATSRMLEVRGPSMAAGAYATPMMKVDVFQKDLEIIGAFAREAGCPVPLFSASVPFFAQASAQGMGGYDTGAVIAVLRKMAGTAS